MKKFAVVLMCLFSTFAMAEETFTSESFCEWFADSTVRGFELAEKGVRYSAVLEHKKNNKDIDEVTEWKYAALQSGFAMHGNGLNVVQTHLRANKLCLEMVNKTH